MRSVAAKQQIKFPLPPGISQVVHDNELKNSPAMCFRSTGVVFTGEQFYKLPQDYQQYILAHEAGHIVNDTRNEFEADDFAVDWCVGQGMSLKNILLAMTRVLSFSDERPLQKAEQEARVRRQYKRLMDFDYEVNKNEKANLNTMCDKCTNGFQCDACLGIDSEMDSFLGIAITKAQKRRKQEKHEMKMEKKHSKNEKRFATADLRRDKGDAKLTLAQQGIDNNPLTAITNSLLGSGEQQQAAEAEQAEGQVFGMPQNTFFIAAGVTLLLIAVAVWYFKFRKTNG